jgi:hypothetical protein
MKIDYDFLIQLVGTVLLLSGIWFTGNKRLLGPFLAFISEFFMAVIGVQHHAWSIVVIGSVLFVIQGRNFLKWRKDGTEW